MTDLSSKAAWDDADWSLLLGATSRLEVAWRETRLPKLADFVPVAADDPRHAEMLLRLVAVDRQWRCRLGINKELAEYDREWPELKGRAVSSEPASTIDHPPRLPASELPGPQPEDGPPRQPSIQPWALRILCPHCHVAVEIIDENVLADIDCPFCGSSFSLLDRGVPVERLAAGPSHIRRNIAHFELIEQLGIGAFGSVWKAKDTQLDKVVALKIPRAGQLAPEEAERFIREARSAAQLSHPNIVAVHAVGRDGDQLYIVSELIDGHSLDEWRAGRQLDPKQAAALCAKIADALQFAHDHGIVHRDLKPQNILMDEADKPHLTDFGLAKRQAGEMTMTVEGQILGTPAYMSPEQARGAGHAADARTDVYSLGVVLFELLTGERPFRGDVAMLLRQVVEEEAPSVRRLNGKVNRDLETICAKCLEKPPARRYATAAEMSDDLRHFLAGEPIHARPVSQPERFWRWCKRQPVVAGLAGASALLIVMVAVVATIGYVGTAKALVKADRALDGEKAARHGAEESLKWESAARQDAVTQTQKAREEEEDAKHNLYFSQISLAQQKWISFDVGEAEWILDTCPPRFRCWEWGYLKHLCHLDLLTLRGYSSSVLSVVFSADGKRLATPCADGTAMICDAINGDHVLTLRGIAGSVLRVAFSPDGKRLAMASDDHTAKIWDTANGHEILTLRGHSSYVCGVAFSPDGKRLATASWDNTAKIWDTTNAQELFALRGHSREVFGVAFRPDGKRLATASLDGTAKIWDATSGEKLLTLRGHANEVFSVAFSADGRQLATASADKTARIWDAASGQELLTLRGHSGMVDGVVFSADGKRLATASRDNTAKIWDTANGHEILTLRGHSSYVSGVAFSPDGRRLATASVDKTVKIWDATNDPAVLTLGGHSSQWVSSVLFSISPDGRRLATASKGATATIWDVASGQSLIALTGHSRRVCSVAFRPDGKRLATASHDGTARIWDTASGQELLTLRGHTSSVYGVVFSPDGKRLATASEDRTAKIWDATSGQEVHTLCGHASVVKSLAFSADGKRLATVSFDKTAKIWNVATGEEMLTLRAHPSLGFSVAFSPDGKRLATAHMDKTVKIWNAESGEEVLTLRGHSDFVFSVAFSPDGKRLVTGSWDKTAKIWDTSSGREVLTLRGHEGCVNCVAFSLDGKRLATASTDKTVKIWDASPYDAPAANNHDNSAAMTDTKK